MTVFRMTKDGQDTSVALGPIYAFHLNPYGSIILEH